MVRTIDNVKDRLCVIRSHAANRDNEAAHSEEDKLYQELLIAIAEGKARQPKAMAALAVTSKDIKFIRYAS